MKTVFIVNPKAGQNKGNEKLVSDILNTAKKLGVEAEVLKTECVGDGTRIARECCEKYGEVRLIACGGDGTLGEVVNGAMGRKTVEIGALPLGTGNDFCRNFQGTGDFSDIEAILNGKAVPCDAICYSTEINGEARTGYCVNMFNIGFDCNVADLTAEMKKKPLISGSFAYFLSILVMLIKKKGANLSISLDGKNIHSGALLLTAIANGKYCGGGVKSNPYASVQDGRMNINVIKNISRLRFISLLGSYMKGTVLERKGVEKIILSTHCKDITITPLSGKMRLCIDGEITDVGKTEFRIVPRAFSFIVPKK